MVADPPSPQEPSGHCLELITSVEPLSVREHAFLAYIAVQKNIYSIYIYRFSVYCLNNPCTLLHFLFSCVIGRKGITS